MPRFRLSDLAKKSAEQYLPEETLDRLIDMADQSAPYTHDWAQRRYQDILFRLDGDLITDLITDDEYDRRLVAMVLVECDDCHGDGHYCNSCHSTGMIRMRYWDAIKGDRKILPGP